MTHRPAPPGSRGCVCAACWHVFSNPGAFDKHQTQSETGTVCHDPADKGMGIVRTTTDGHPVWGQPVSDADRARLAHLRRAA